MNNINTLCFASKGDTDQTHFRPLSSSAARLLLTLPKPTCRTPCASSCWPMNGRKSETEKKTRRKTTKRRESASPIRPSWSSKSWRWTEKCWTSFLPITTKLVCIYSARQMPVRLNVCMFLHVLRLCAAQLLCWFINWQSAYGLSTWMCNHMDLTCSFLSLLETWESHECVKSPL